MPAHREDAGAIELRDPDDDTLRAARRAERQGEPENIRDIVDRIMLRAAARREAER